MGGFRVDKTENRASGRRQEGAHRSRERKGGDSETSPQHLGAHMINVNPRAEKLHQKARVRMRHMPSPNRLICINQAMNQLSIYIYHQWRSQCPKPRAKTMTSEPRSGRLASFRPLKGRDLGVMAELTFNSQNERSSWTQDLPGIF